MKKTNKQTNSNFPFPLEASTLFSMPLVPKVHLNFILEASHISCVKGQLCAHLLTVYNMWSVLVCVSHSWMSYIGTCLLFMRKKIMLITLSCNVSYIYSWNHWSRELLCNASERPHRLLKTTTCNNYYLLCILYVINTLEVCNGSWDVCVTLRLRELWYGFKDTAIP